MRAPILIPRTHENDPFDARVLDGVWTQLAASVNRLAGVDLVRFTLVQEPRPVMPLEGGDFGGQVAAPALYVLRPGQPAARVLTATDGPTPDAVGGVRAVPLPGAELVGASPSGTVSEETVAALEQALTVLLGKLRACGFLASE